MPKLLCIEPAEKDNFNKDSRRISSYLKSISCRWSRNMKVWKVVRFRFDHAWNKRKLSWSSFFQQNFFYHHYSFHCQSLLATMNVCDCSKVCGHIYRTASALALPSEYREAEEVDCFCSRKLQDVPALRCWFCCFQELTLRPSLLGSRVSFRHQAPDQDEFRRPLGDVLRFKNDCFIKKVQDTYSHRPTCEE